MKKFLALALCALLIVPMIAAVSAADELNDVTFRWDFDDLNEKNGLNNLTLSELAQDNADLYEIKDGMIYLNAHDIDFDLDTPIILDDAHDWSIEWRAAQADYCILFGANSKESLIYLAAGVAQWNDPIRIIPDGTENPVFVDDSNRGISFGDYLDAAYEMNTWRIVYTADDMNVVVEILDGDKWEEVGSATTDQEYTITLTNMFGRYGEDGFVNFFGEVDYIEVKCRAAVEAPATEDTTAPAVEDTTAPAVEDTTAPAVEDTTAPAVEDTTAPAVEDTTAPAVEDTTAPAVTEQQPTETPDAPATADIAVVLAAVAAIATSGAIVLKKKH